MIGQQQSHKVICSHATETWQKETIIENLCCVKQFLAWECQDKDTDDLIHKINDVIVYIEQTERHLNRQKGNLMIEVGQKCRYIDPFGVKQDGIVISTDNGGFTVCEPLDIPPQYNDSFMDFTDADVGERVWFD